ncbi:MAG: tetratricopeptide repeat protein [Candidatus Eisenbacteria bacterium]|nr:tetratricopeptide repeat protein [Candidatus Eisenbacteria bacterium]
MSLREGILLAVIVLAGVLLRVSYLSEFQREPVFHTPISDAAFHDYWARGIVSGNWAVAEGEPDPRIPQVPFLRPPGYAYFLAGIYKVFGADPHSARVFQMVLGLVNVVLAFLLGRAILGRTAGFLLAAFCSLYWVFPYYEAELHAPAIFITLALLLFLVLHSWLQKPDAKKVFAAGLITGALALLRAETLLFVPVAWWWMARARKQAPAGSGRWAAWRPGAIFALATALAIAPATLRNAVVAKEFVPISANAAINFYIGNNETSDGVTTRIPGLSEIAGTAGWSCFSYDQIIQAMSQQEGRPLTYTAASRIFNDRAFDYISGHFGRFLALTLKRAALFWGPDEVANNSAIADEKAHSAALRWNPGFAPVFGLSLLGLILMIAQRMASQRGPGQKRGRIFAMLGGVGDEPRPVVGERQAAGSSAPPDTAMPLLIGLFVLAGFVAVLPFIAASRFRAPYIPFIFVFGAFGLERLIAWLRGKSWRPLGIALGLAVVFTILGSISFAGYRTDPAWWHTDRALALWRADRVDEAAAEFRAALGKNPGFVDAHVWLAGLLTQQGKLQEAESHYALVLQHRPDRIDLRLKLGSLLLQLDKPAEAKIQLEEVVRRNPNLFEGWFEYGRALDGVGEVEASRTAFARSLELNPDEPSAFVNQAVALMRAGKAAEALPLLQRAVQMKPDLAPGYLWLGQAYAETKESEKARAAYQEAIRLDPKNPLPYVYIGVLASGQQNVEEAARWFRMAIEADPNNSAAHFNLAGMLATQGKIDQAIAEFEEVLRLEPGNQAARQYLARLRSNRRL